MNDLEREIRDTLLRHQGDAPPLDVSDAHRTAGRARRRQARNVVIGIAGAAAVIVTLAAPGGLLRADRSITPIAPPPSSSTCVATPGPDDHDGHGWFTTSKNAAGVYSWDHHDSGAYSIEGFMHNGYRPGSGKVNIFFEGQPGRLTPHRGQTAVTVAGCEATYRQFITEAGPGLEEEGPTEEWMVDIQGTTVTIRLIAEPGAPADEVAEAHQIIESIRKEPQDNPLGFRLSFTVTTDTWDSG